MLHHFSTLNTNLAGVQINWDGAAAAAGVIAWRNTLYGVAPSGGTNGDGVVFSLALPALTIGSVTVNGTSVVIEAVNGEAGSTCTLLTSTNLALPLNQWSPLVTNVFPVS